MNSAVQSIENIKKIENLHTDVNVAEYLSCSKSSLSSFKINNTPGSILERLPSDDLSLDAIFFAKDLVSINLLQCVKNIVFKLESDFEFSSHLFDKLTEFEDSLDSYLAISKILETKQAIEFLRKIIDLFSNDLKHQKVSTLLYIFFSNLNNQKSHIVGTSKNNFLDFIDSLESEFFGNEISKKIFVMADTLLDEFAILELFHKSFQIMTALKSFIHNDINSILKKLNDFSGKQTIAKLCNNIFKNTHSENNFAVAFIAILKNVNLMQFNNYKIKTYKKLLLDAIEYIEPDNNNIFKRSNNPDYTLKIKNEILSEMRNLIVKELSEYDCLIIVQNNYQLLKALDATINPIFKKDNHYPSLLDLAQLKFEILSSKLKF